MNTSSEIDRSRLIQLARKYAGAAPRYTSYPTAVEFGGGVSACKWRELLEAEFSADSTRPVSLYFHLPFCKTLCYFCACNKIIAKDRSGVRPYLEALKEELKAYSRLLPNDLAVEQLHWGGGTPNFLLPEEMCELFGEVGLRFPRRVEDAEVSVEIDPRTFTLSQLDALNRLGFNRVSYGVQDFTAEVQEAVNRIQPYEMTAELCRAARGSGFSGVNVDLIYGLPLQTEDGFARTVDRILELRPDRVALYGYAHVTWVKKVQRALEREHLPTPDERIAIFARAVEMFTLAGYRHIGLDHFALPEDSLSAALDSGKLNRNFMGYTTHKGSRLLGFGVSSISMLPSGFAQNFKELGHYQERVTQDGIAVERGVLRSAEDRLRSDVIEQLLCSGVVDMRLIGASHGVNFRQHFAESLAALGGMVEDGLVRVTEDRVELSEMGRFFARSAAMQFDAYLKKHREASAPVFSQAV